MIECLHPSFLVKLKEGKKLFYLNKIYIILSYVIFGYFNLCYLSYFILIYF
jgi:hypothetical protein